LMSHHLLNPGGIRVIEQRENRGQVQQSLHHNAGLLDSN
jgi:hypothetical protein